MPSVVYSSTAHGDANDTVIANHESYLEHITLCPPSLVGIQTWDPDHDQSVTNDALDRSAMVSGFSIMVKNIRPSGYGLPTLSHICLFESLNFFNYFISTNQGDGKSDDSDEKRHAQHVGCNVQNGELWKDFSTLMTKIDVAFGAWGLYNYYRMEVGPNQYFTETCSTVGIRIPDI